MKFLKKKGNKSFETMLDVGAHRGETIDIFLKHFKINKLIYFEPSPLNFSVLKKKETYNKNKF